MVVTEFGAGVARVLIDYLIKKVMGDIFGWTTFLVLFKKAKFPPLSSIPKS